MNTKITNKDNLPNWHFKDGMICMDIYDKYPMLYGFVYKITYSDHTFYIGKKVFYNILSVPTTKKGKSEVIGSEYKRRIKGKGLIPYVDIKKESNWKKYTGSNDTEPIDIINREILDIAYSKLHLTFLENRYLYTYLLFNSCRNISIANKIFRDRVRQDIGDYFDVRDEIFFKYRAG